MEIRQVLFAFRIEFFSIYRKPSPEIVEENRDNDYCRNIVDEIQTAIVIENFSK